MLIYNLRLIDKRIIHPILSNSIFSYLYSPFARCGFNNVAAGNRNRATVCWHSKSSTDKSDLLNVDRILEKSLRGKRLGMVDLGMGLIVGVTTIAGETIISLSRMTDRRDVVIWCSLKRLSVLLIFFLVSICPNFSLSAQWL